MRTPERQLGALGPIVVVWKESLALGDRAPVQLDASHVILGAEVKVLAQDAVQVSGTPPRDGEAIDEPRRKQSHNEQIARSVSVLRTPVAGGQQWTDADGLNEKLNDAG